jgi:hypothetical protein
MRHGTRSYYVHGPCRCEDCRTAEAEYQRTYRAANRERLLAYDRSPARDTRLRDDPTKRRARERAYDNLQRGRPPRPCESCGGAGAQLHHADYSKPLEVRWLCAQCHGREHRQPNTRLACGV